MPHESQHSRASGVRSRVDFFALIKRAPPRSDQRTVASRGTRWRELSNLCRESPCADPSPRRYRHYGQSRKPRGKAVRELIRSTGAKLFFLPKYSPDLNPIEQAFAKLKHLLRKANARSVEAISATISRILRTCSSSVACRPEGCL